MIKAGWAGCVVAAVALCFAAGCGGTSCVRAEPVWSPEAPSYGFVWARTTNVFPFYSVSRVYFPDRMEEYGNVLLFISWDKVLPRSVVPEVACPVPTESAKPSTRTPESSGGAEAAKESTDNLKT